MRVHLTGRKVYIVKFRHHGHAVKATIGPHSRITPAGGRGRRRSSPRRGRVRTQRRGAGTTPRPRPYGSWPNVSSTSTSGSLQAQHPNGLPQAIGAHIDPRLGARRVADIERRDIVALHAVVPNLTEIADWPPGLAVDQLSQRGLLIPSTNKANLVRSAWNIRGPGPGPMPTLHTIASTLRFTPLVDSFHVGTPMAYEQRMSSRPRCLSASLAPRNRRW